jgi:hypothetical protein
MVAPIAATTATSKANSMINFRTPNDAGSFSAFKGNRQRESRFNLKKRD